MKDKEIYDDQNYITYKTKFWKILSSGFTIIIPFIFFCYILSINKGSFSEKVLIAFFIFLFGGLLIYIIYRYLACSKQVLQISIDDDTFYFNDGTSEKKYNKNNIEKITIYQPGRGWTGGNTDGRLHYFYVYELLFKDRSILKFSNMLISEAQVLSNFSNDIIRYDPKSPFLETVAIPRCPKFNF